MTYDSRPETREHIQSVADILWLAEADLDLRGQVHDASKLAPPEVGAFDEISPLLRTTDYGSPEYRENLRRIKPAIEHHYAENDHHPEHFGDVLRPGDLGDGGTLPTTGGIFDMNAVQLIEMCCDWIAASRRHPDGDVLASLPHNAERFGYAGTALERTIGQTVSYLLELEARGGIPGRQRA